MYGMTIPFLLYTALILQEAGLVCLEITLSDVSMTNRLVYNNLVDHEE